MTFRRRIALLAGLSFVAAVLACSLAGFVTVRREMLARVDADLTSRVATDPLGQPGLGNLARPTGQGTGGGGGRPSGAPAPRATDVWFQTIESDGSVETPSTQSAVLPVDDDERALAGQPAGTAPIVRDVTVDGVHLRMVTAATGQQRAVQVARPLTEVDQTLRAFAVALVAVSVLGTIVAAGVGWAVARRSARPVQALGAAAEHAASTLEFDPAHFRREAGPAPRHADEISRLADSIDAMLTALQSSRDQQHRLVLDASHEFRTPLTSLRTNVDLLAHPGLDESMRADIVTDLQAELAELTDLTTELVELATDTQTAEQPELVDLTALVRRVTERAARRTGQSIEVRDEPWSIWGRPLMLERAVQNVIDNACKWNPPDRPIEIEVRDAHLRVRDHGPGIPAAERQLVFQRFYRTESARTTPGSGLGLAIVAQNVAAHGGTASIADADGDGTVVDLWLPVTAAPGDADVPGPAEAGSPAVWS